MDAAWTRSDLNRSNRRDSYSGSSLLKINKMNNNSKVLALKYRPQTFESLIGQEVVAETITNSNHIDVLEMDAASKTGVDDVRDLIEFSRYGPTSSKYKIFIIDEVGPYLENSIKSLTSSTPVLLAASISRTSIWFEFVIASQFSQIFSLHKFSIPFRQFNALATILAVVVLPIPLIPVNK